MDALVWRRAASLALMSSVLGGCFLVFDFGGYDTSRAPTGGDGGSTGDATTSGAFTLGADPSSIHLRTGEVGSVTVAVTRLSGFTAPVVIAVESAPPLIDVTRREGGSEDRVTFDISARTALASGEIVFVGASGNAAERTNVTVSADPPAGTLDPTFGDGGVVLLTPSPRKMAFDGQGRLLVVTDTVLWRFLPSGAPDPAFGDGGATAFVAPNASPIDLALDDTATSTLAFDTIDVVTGRTVEARRFAASGAQDFRVDGGVLHVPRLVPGGPDLIDGTYGAAASSGDAWLVARVIAGNSVPGVGYVCPCHVVFERFGATGAKDTSFVFASAGRAIVPVKILPTTAGGAMLAGDTYHMTSIGGIPDIVVDGFFALSVLGTGAADPAFGDGGLGVVTFAEGPSACNEAIVRDGQGRVLLAGGAGSSCTTPPISTRLVLARLLPSGTPDPGFGAGGRVVLVNVPGRAKALALQPDGKVLAAGTRGDVSTPFSAFVVRIEDDGGVDPSFHAGTSPDGTALDVGAGSVALAVDYRDGRIVVAGSHGDAGSFLARILP